MPKPKSQDENPQSAKERLLEAALDTFGRYGYEAATTRMIAKEAGVNIAAIPYYFNGKEGLYMAVIDHIVTIITNHLEDIHLAAAGLDLSGPQAKEEATALIEMFFNRLISFMVGAPQAPRVSRIIFREQLYPSAAYDRIFSGFMAAAIDTAARLIMAISETTSERTAKIRALTLIGQVLIFRIARETAVRSLAMEGYSGVETEEIRQVVNEHTRSILAGLRHD